MVACTTVACTTVVRSEVACTQVTCTMGGGRDLWLWESNYYDFSEFSFIFHFENCAFPTYYILIFMGTHTIPLVNIRVLWEQLYLDHKVIIMTNISCLLAFCRTAISIIGVHNEYWYIQVQYIQCILTTQVLILSKTMPWIIDYKLSFLASNWGKWAVKLKSVSSAPSAACNEHDHNQTIYHQVCAKYSGACYNSSSAVSQSFLREYVSGWW